MRKRITSLFLVLALCLTLLPTAALAVEQPEAVNSTAVQAASAEKTESSVASVVIDGTTSYYDTLNEAIAAAYEADNDTPLTVTLLNDVAELNNSNSSPRSSATIEMGGKSLGYLWFLNKTLTLKNGVIQGHTHLRSGGGLVLTAPAGAAAAIDGSLNIAYISGEGSGTAKVSGAKIGVKGTLSVENSAAGAVVISGSDKAVDLSKEATLFGCRLYGSTEENGSPDTVAVYDADQKTYTVNGVTAKTLVSGPTAVVAVTPGDTLSVMAGEAQEYTAQFTAEDVVTGSVKGLSNLKAEVENAADKHITVTTEENAADGTWKVTVQTTKDTPLGTYTLKLWSEKDEAVSGSVQFKVSETKYAASVNGTNYRSLSAAIDAAKKTNGTVTLLDNVTDSITVTDGTFTIDLNGKTWTGASGSRALTVNGGEVTLSSTGGAGTIVGSDTTKFAVQVDSGTVHLKENVTLSDRIYIADQNGGSVTFEPGVTVTKNIMTRSHSVVRFLDGLALMDLGKTGYVPFYNRNTQSEPFSGVTVVAHRDHNMVDGVCDQCGYVCGHLNAKAEDTVCPDCDAAFIAASTAAGGTVTRYTNADAALAAAAGNAKVTFVPGTYTLKNAVSFSGRIETEIDLNGATLQYASGDQGVVFLITEPYENITITLKNGTVQNTGEGTGIGLYSTTYGSARTVLTLEDVTVIGGVDTFKTRQAAVNVANRGNTLTVKSGSFSGPLDLNLAQNTVKLYGGTYQNGITGSMYRDGGWQYELSAEDYAVLLDNSDPTKQYAYADGANGAVISYATVAERMNDRNDTNNSIQVKEHTHAMGDANTCTACGFVCTSHKYEKGVCAICHAECPHANVDTSTRVCSDCGLTMVAAATVKDSENNDITTYTADLAAAMNNAADGTTFTLLADVTLNEYIEVAGKPAKTLTLDLQDHTIHSAKFSIGEIDVNGKAGTAGTLKITGSGSLLNENTAILVWEDGKLDLTDWKDGTISSVGLGYNNEGSVTGKSEPQITVGADAGRIGRLMFRNWYVSSIGASTLKGGSYDQITMNTDQQSVNIETLLPTGYAFQKNDGTLKKRITTIAELGEIPNVSVVKCTVHEDTDGDKKCDYCSADLEADAVATLTVDGKTYFYTDLPSALKAASDKGGTVQLQQDVTGLTEKLDINHSKGFAITLDLNGHTISGADHSGSTLLAVSTFGTVTIDDTSSAKTGKIVGENGGGYAVCVSDGKLIITGGTFEGTDVAGTGGLSGQAGYALGTAGGELIINGGTFNSAVEAQDKLTVSGGTFKKAVNITARRATITGGIFEGAFTMSAQPNEFSGGVFKQQASFSNVSDILTGGTFEKGLSTTRPWPGLASLLTRNYKYKTTGGWHYLDGVYNVTDNVTVAEVPIHSPVSLIAYPGSKEYGKSQDITLSASCGGSAEDLYVGWFLVHEDDTQTLVSNGGKGLTKVENKSATYTLPAGLAIGRHTYRVFFCDKNVQDGENTPSDAYIETADITIEITKIDIANVPEDQIELELVYGGNVPYNIHGATNADGVHATTMALSPVEPFKVNGTELNENDYTLEGNVQYGVGEYTLKINVDTAIYTGSIERTWHVIPHKLGLPQISQGDYEKTYDGGTALPKGITYFNGYFEAGGKDFFLSSTKLEPSDYTLTNEAFENATVGKDKRTSFTIQLKNKNYEFNTSYIEGLAKDGITVTADAITYTNRILHRDAHFDITPATVPDFNKEVTLDIVNDLENTYTIDLPALPALESPKTYGDITYTVASQSLEHGYATLGQPTVKQVDGKYQLCLTVPAVKYDQETSIGTILVKVTTTNYEPVTLIVNLQSVNKFQPAVDVQAEPKTVTYGTTLANITPVFEALYDGQTVGGTVTWDLPADTKPGTDTKYLAWTFTPSDPDKYFGATGNASITVTPATLTGAPKYTVITVSGKKLSDADLTVNESWPAGTVKWVDKDGNNLPENTEVKANTAYQWKFTPDSKNYDPIEGSITLYYVSTGGGGSTTYPVSTPSKTENGSVSVSPKNASRGDTVTITVKPDDGYDLDDLTVTDKNGNDLKLTDKGNGKYTFTMPAGKVEVKASFAEEAETSPFADVATNAYYYEAVKWAAEQGITGGIGNNLFGPNQPCTRAQIVTFLWRAAGSPEPKDMSSFADVSTDSYYAKAVAWAVENGITSGTGDGKFSPDATCTRAQAVTFLARALNAKATSAAEFSDVPTDSYFAEAVAWAASNGVTAGIGGGLFGPNNDCTRAQIVTFLFRAYNK